MNSAGGRSRRSNSAGLAGEPLVILQRLRRWMDTFPGWVWSLLSAAQVVILWELIGRILDVSFLPPFSEVAARLYELFATGEIAPKLATSLSNLAIGFTIAAVVGTVLGSLMGISWRIEAMFDGYVYTLLSTPTLIFAPILFVLFGIGRGVVISIIILYAVVYITINTMDAMRSAPVGLIEMSRSFGGSRIQIFRKVILPAALPLMLAGFLVAIPRSVKGMINGEMFLAAIGLGAIVIRAAGQFDATTVLAMLLLVILFSFFFLGIFRYVENRMLSWLPDSARGGTGADAVAPEREAVEG